MGAPVDLYSDLVEKFRSAFQSACPDIPVCKERIDSVFASLSMTHDGFEYDGLYKMERLAADLGLSIGITVGKREKIDEA